MAILTASCAVPNPKRSATIFDTDNSADRPAQSEKRHRIAGPGTTPVQDVVADREPTQPSQKPESGLDSQLFDRQPEPGFDREASGSPALLTQLPEAPTHDRKKIKPRIRGIKAGARETARVDAFIDHYEMLTKTPTKFTVVLKYLGDEQRQKLNELCLIDDDYRGGGHRMRVTWGQYGRLLKLKVHMEVEEYPDNFTAVLKWGDKSAERETGA